LEKAGKRPGPAEEGQKCTEPDGKKEEPGDFRHPKKWKPKQTLSGKKRNHQRPGGGGKKKTRRGAPRWSRQGILVVVKFGGPAN